MCGDDKADCNSQGEWTHVREAEKTATFGGERRRQVGESASKMMSVAAVWLINIDELVLEFVAAH